jgi:hypothetical protein
VGTNVSDFVPTNISKENKSKATSIQKGVAFAFKRNHKKTKLIFLIVQVFYELKEKYFSISGK